jgi:hypothetical protein
MKKWFFVFCGIFLFLLVPVSVDAGSFDCFPIDGASIFGWDSWDDNYQFIGSISNKFGSESIGNQFGAGNKFSSDSIMNSFGDYGSKYGSASAFNSLATHSPILIDKYDKFIGYLTTNQFKTPGISPYLALSCADSSFKSSISKHENYIFPFVPSGSNSWNGSGSYNLPTAPIVLCYDLVNGYAGSDGTCYCNNGFVWSENELKCIDKCLQYDNSHRGTDGGCYCDDGYQNNADKTACVPMECPEAARVVGNTCVCNGEFVLKDNVCKNATLDCSATFGPNVYGKKKTNTTSDCYCKDGYEWNVSSTRCFKTAENSPDSVEVISPSVLSKSIVDPAKLEEVLSQGLVRNEAEESKYSILIEKDSKEFKIDLSTINKGAITNFVSYGISNKTIALGAGERRAVVRDYLETVGKENVNWEDIERMVNGEKIVDRNLEKEQAQVTAALKIFKKIFKHDPVFSNAEEDLGWNTLLYRIRFPRDLEKEKEGITKFKKIFWYSPKTPMDWAAVRVLGYVKQ